MENDQVRNAHHAMSVLAAFCMAVIDSHPDQDALRAAWDVRVSELWTASAMAGTPLPGEAQLMKALIEQAFRPRP